eukprot:CAMPEP_0175058686 /NCGR_PEP_ID=MMETSP0052_2-20121109/11991_1 /TAXON_ID=51329 ORGANISM="Polytomella parva, Strain SAG 63-3" /NCGR_SAMPLE_ID=MMETSP0052_2 /ASSEMBLY_ACC=CAM_ASM_000194 /LENGTH=485 /DNA_ID=CAMNT_0016324105 /DNA_START=153 /DNA_END=1607 /DNA_ORIENTATION=+
MKTNGFYSQKTVSQKTRHREKLKDHEVSVQSPPISTDLIIENDPSSASSGNHFNSFLLASGSDPMSSPSRTSKSSLSASLKVRDREKSTGRVHRERESRGKRENRDRHEGEDDGRDKRDDNGRDTSTDRDFPPLTTYTNSPSPMLAMPQMISPSSKFGYPSTRLDHPAAEIDGRSYYGMGGGGGGGVMAMDPLGLNSPPPHYYGMGGGEESNGIMSGAYRGSRDSRTGSMDMDENQLRMQALSLMDRSSSGGIGIVGSTGSGIVGLNSGGGSGGAGLGNGGNVGSNGIGLGPLADGLSSMPGMTYSPYGYAYGNPYSTPYNPYGAFPPPSPPSSSIRPMAQSINGLPHQLSPCHLPPPNRSHQQHLSHIPNSPHAFYPPPSPQPLSPSPSLPTSSRGLVMMSPKGPLVGGGNSSANQGLGGVGNGVAAGVGNAGGSLLMPPPSLNNSSGVVIPYFGYYPPPPVSSPHAAFHMAGSGSGGSSNMGG